MEKQGKTACKALIKESQCSYKDNLDDYTSSPGDMVGTVEELTSDLGPKALPPINEKALVRRIDWHLIPILFIIYVAAFLDR